jgi:hypothetical protein
MSGSFQNLNILFIRTFVIGCCCAPHYSCFLWMWKIQAFPLIGLLFGWWVVSVAPGFVSPCDPQEVGLFISDLSQQFLTHKHAPACAHLWALETPTTWRYTACWNSPSEFIDLYHMRCITSRLVLHLSCWQSRELSPHFDLCSLWKGSLIAHHLTTEVSLHLNGGKDMLTIALFLKASWRVSCMYIAVFLSLKQNLIKLHCYFEPCIRKLWIALYIHHNKHSLKSKAVGYGYRTY